MQKKELGGLLTALLVKHEPDLLILAESTIPFTSRVSDHYNPVLPIDTSGSKLKLFRKKGSYPLANTHLNHNGSLSVWSLNCGKRTINLCAVHLVAKVATNGEEQSHEARTVVDHIRTYERKVGSEDTLVIGDFNMNPFESGMIATWCFNSKLTSSLLYPTKLAGELYEPFYNPMWSHYGNVSEGNSPPGTHFYSKNNRINIYWHMLDQVIMRKSLVPCFLRTRILTEPSMLNRFGRPGKQSSSDHLPLLADFEFGENNV